MATKLREYFAPSTAAIVDELWFEYEHTPLRWHYPVGVLFDMLGDTTKLPWHIVVRFRGFPSSEILRCPNSDTVKQHYVNVLKEANYLKHGDGGRVNGLSLEDSTNLYASFSSVFVPLTCFVSIHATRIQTLKSFLPVAKVGTAWCVVSSIRSGAPTTSWPARRAK